MKPRLKHRDVDPLVQSSKPTSNDPLLPKEEEETERTSCAATSFQAFRSVPFEHPLARRLFRAWGKPDVGDDLSDEIMLHACEVMEEVGVKVDPNAWATLVYDLEDRFISENAVERLNNLQKYSELVLGMAGSDPANRVRAQWSPATWTGRIGASEPPLQGVTKAGDLRRAIGPRDGHLLLVADLDCSHLRLAAAVAGSLPLQEALLPGSDLHDITGTLIAPGKPRDVRRKIGKSVNFSVLYLGGARSICKKARDYGISIGAGTARDYKERWLDQFSAIRDWHTRMKTTREFRSPLGRSCSVPADRPNPHSSVLAGQLQAIESDIMAVSLAELLPFLDGIGGCLVLVVHDELVFEVPDSRAHEALGRVKRVMETAQWLGCQPCSPSVSVELRTSWAACDVVEVG